MSTRPKVLALIIARLTSSRLPRKQLRKINGIPLIQHIIERLQKVQGIDQIILATGPHGENHDLADFIRPLGVETYFDPDVDDVTGRIYRASQAFNAEIVVTISGDCPLVDVAFLTEGIGILANSSADYVFVNKEKYQCLHEGLGFHKLDTWKRLDELSTTWSHREHAGSVIYETSHLFKGVEIIPEPEFRRQDIRISVDTQADLDFINRLYSISTAPGTSLDLRDMLAIIENDPQILAINSHVHQKGLLEKSKNIWIVTYASSRLGMGHLTRMLALAREMKEAASTKITFIVNEDEICSTKIAASDFPMIMWKDAGSLQSLISAQLAEDRINGVIVDLKVEDLYGAFKFLCNLEVPLTVIDVWPEITSSNNLTIIPSFACSKQRNRENIYCGSEYILLNREILNIQTTLENRNSILVTAGGSGTIPQGLLYLLSQLQSDIITKFVVGPYTDADILKKSIRAAGLNNYEVFQNPENILELFAEARFAFSVFGITTSELMALGIPQCIYAVVNPSDMEIVNQLRGEQSLIESISGSDAQAIESIQNLLDNPMALQLMGSKAHQLVDGEGAIRVASLVSNHVGNGHSND